MTVSQVPDTSTTLIRDVADSSHARCRTDLLVDLLDVAAKDDSTDSLVLICQTLIRNVPAFKFVTFVHVGEDIWHIPCAQPGFQVRLAPPDVERAFVRFLEGELANWRRKRSPSWGRNTCCRSFPRTAGPSGPATRAWLFPFGARGVTGRS